jgi:hypothetical protein
LNLTEALAALRGRAAPSLRLVESEGGRSRLGGRPCLGPEFAWPERNGSAMSFLAQLDLGEVRSAGGPDWLPDRGLLLFFYDENEGAWGFSPDDRGGWAVLYDAAPEGTSERPWPPTSPETLYAPITVTVRPHESLPSPNLLEIEPDALDEADWDELYNVVAGNDGDPPWHQVGGWPRPIQNEEMELECQFASNGIYCGNPDSYHSDAAKSLVPGAAEWRLLLQLDSDEDTGMMWGDSGMLYFWIRESEARTGDFSNVWMILQCY